MRQNKLKNDQRGMAAIIVTMVLMVVISITVLGFSQTIRREQRNALDHQLVTQAYYAAESGVNLAQDRIKKILVAGTAVPDKTNCEATTYGGQPIIEADYTISNNSAITCLMIQSKLKDLQFQKVSMNAVTTLVKADTGTIDTINISWQSSNSTSITGCSGGSSFYPKTGTDPGDRQCAQPILRIDLVPLPGVTNIDRDLLKTKQFTTFLSPNSAAGVGAAPYSPLSVTPVPSVFKANCNATTSAVTPRLCKLAITGLSSSIYGLRIMSIYGDSDVTITANSGSDRVTLVEGQVLIDSTARAQDVLRRVQVRMSVTGSAPDFALVAGGDGNGGICKRYVVSAGVASIDGPAACNIP